MVNEYAWNKTKAFFENIGSYLSGKFDEIKAFFTEQANRTLPTHSSYWQPPGHLFPILPQSRIQKRSLYKWYESVWLMYLIKNIETVFRYFDFELQQDEEVSEAKIAEYLAKIWQALARCQINNNATEEFTLNVLKKLNTSIFRDDFFNISQPCSIEMESMIPTVLLPTSRSINRISQRNKRQVTAVPLETDFLESEFDDRKLALADDFFYKQKNNRKHAQSVNKTNKLANTAVHATQFLSDANENNEQAIRIKSANKRDCKRMLSKQYQFMASNQSSAPAKSTPKFSFCKPLKIPEKDFSFKNTSSHHLPIVERHSKKNISQEIKFFPLLKQDRGFFMVRLRITILSKLLRVVIYTVHYLPWISVLNV